MFKGSLVPLRLETPKLFAWLVVAAGCSSEAPGSEESGEETVGETRAELSAISNVTRHGNLSLVSGRDAVVNATRGWADIPRLGTGVYATGGPLEITVTADVEVSGSVWFRAIVNESVASPSDVLFFRSGSANRGTRSFTFVLPSVAAGFHLVRIQSYSGTAASTVRTRSLSVRAGGTRSDLGQHAFAVPASGASITKPRAGWIDVPGLSTSITNALTAEMEVNVSAEVWANRGRILVRALVDGVPAQPGDVTLVQQGHRAAGTRSATFRLRQVAAGTHTISAQWYTDDGADVWIGDRSLSVFASRASSADGGADLQAFEGSPVTLSSSWGASIYGLVPAGDDPAAGVRVMAQGEAWRTGGSGRIWMRALIDGVPAEPGEVILDAESSITNQSFLFSRRNFAAGGSHLVQLQFRADSGTAAQVRDRAIAASGMRRTGADFAEAQPFLNNLRPRQGAFDVLTICLDPVRPGHARPTEAQIRAAMEGTDGMANVRGLLSQNSGSRFRVNNHRMVGCGTNWYVPPPEHQGTWYWDNSSTVNQHFVVMRHDALVAADADVDFHAYDRNADGNVTPDELVVQVCLPQGSPDGYAGRTGTANLDGIGPLTVSFLDCYFSASPSQRLLQVGVLTHELAHATTGGHDFYGNFPSFNAGPFSLMASTWNAPHLDPYHKLHSGWLAPVLVNADTWVSRDVALPAVETSREALLLYRATRNNTEYYIVENRFNGTLGGQYNYDSLLPRSGIAVWHVIEDPAVAALVPPGVDAAAYTNQFATYGWAVGGVRFGGVLAASEVRDLRWADGSAVGLRLTALGANTETVSVRITKPTGLQLPPVGIPPGGGVVSP